MNSIIGLAEIVLSSINYTRSLANQLYDGAILKGFMESWFNKGLDISSIKTKLEEEKKGKTNNGGRW